MTTAISSSFTRRGVVAGLALTAAPPAALGTAKSAYAQPKQSIPDKSLYERLGGVFAIAAVVDHFSDAVVKNPIVGQKSKNSQLREWHTKQLGRLPGLKFMRTLATFRVGPSNSRPPSPARHRLVLRRPIETSGFPPQNSMRLRQNSDGPWTSSKSRSARRAKSGQPSRPIRTISQPVTPGSTAEANGFPAWTVSARPKLGGELLAAR